MTDDLVKRLRLIGEKRQQCTACYKFIETADEATDRIKKLESEEEDWNRICNSYAARVDELEAALREIVGALDDPKGGQHVYDMRNASYIARNALEGKDD